MQVDRALILGRLEDLPVGAMRAVEVAGKKILLVRQADGLTAIGAECPHAGGPLAEGVLVDGQVICPWHKAAFCTRTGARLEPPAVDDLPRFALRIEQGDILLQDAEAPPQAAPAAPDARRFVILGAGAAGFSAAQALREIGFAGAISLVSAEAELPYDRTVLSKYVLAGQEAGEKSPLQDAEFYAARRIERITAEIVHLDAEQRLVGLSDGRVLHYDKALVATGGEIVRPPFPGGELRNVFTLRSRSDVERILAAAAVARRAVVIGASFIGMEVAAALRERGLEVTVAGTETAPFEKQLGAAVGNVYRAIHEEKGVRFRLGASVERLVGDGAVREVVLEGGERLAADLVVAGLGVRPATEFAGALAREGDQALEVDVHLRVVPHLFAAGDVAAFPIYGKGERIRVEHWRVAEQQGRIAARNMVGQEAIFRGVPYFWTIQYMIRLDYAGHASGADEQLLQGDLAGRDFRVFYLRDGVVKAAAGMNRDREMAAIIALMNRRQDWKVADLASQAAAMLAR